MIKRALLFTITALWIFLSHTGFAVEKTIIMSGTNWEPYTGENLLNKGFFTEITQKALEAAGYNVTIVIHPWKRSFEATKHGTFDGLMGISYTQERTTFFKYPKYAWKNRTHFFAHKNGFQSFEKVEDLCPATLGILRGSFYIKHFEAYPCLKQDLANNVIINTRKLIKGRIDLLIESADAIHFILGKYFPKEAHKVVAIQPAYQVDKIYTAFSRKNPDHITLANDFDRGIQLIKNSGEYDSILQKHKWKN